MNRLMTAQQVCDHFGIPSPRTVQTMRGQGLAAVRLGKAYLYDSADVAAFIQDKKTSPVRTVVPVFNGLPSAGRFISSGSITASDEFALRAQASAERLKQPSRPSSMPRI